MYYVLYSHKICFNYTHVLVVIAGDYIYKQNSNHICNVGQGSKCAEAVKL